MPAAAVIPAPIAYIKVVAVKKLVVGHKTRPLVDRQVALVLLRLTAGDLVSHPWVDWGTEFTVKKLECSKQALLLEYASME